MFQAVFSNNTLFVSQIQDSSEASEDSADLQRHTRLIELLFLCVKQQAT